MNISKQNLVKTYLILLMVSLYTPKFQVFDKMTLHVFLLSISNFFVLISIPFIFKQFSLIKVLKNPLVLLFFGYIGVALLSIVKSINVVESFVRLSQILTFGFTLLFLVFFINKKLVKINFILILITISLIVDVFFSIKEYIPFLIYDIPYTYDENTRLVGLYGNRNILASVLSFKIPIVIFAALRFNKKWLNLISFFLVTVTFFNIMLLSSRATYLAIIISITFILVVSAYKYLKDKKSYFKSNSSIIIFYFLTLFFAYVLSTNVIDSSDQGDVINRISSITSSEEDISKNTRLRYYSQSLEHLSKNPFLGAGIGNWKIWSIKYDSKDIENYIIPYNAHNDILEAAVETGIFGGLLFLSFFLMLMYYIFILLKSNISVDKNYTMYVLLAIPFIIYFVDLNLNFPSSRGSNPVFYLMYLSIILILKNSLDEK